MAVENLRGLRAVYHIIMIFGIFAIFMNCVWIKSPELDSEYFGYYFSYVIVGAAGILLTSLVQRIKKCPYVLRMIPYYIPFVYGYSICCYVILCTSNTFNGVVGYATMGLVTILCLHIEPVIFCIVLSCVYGVIFKNIRLAHGFAGVVDIGILNLLFMSLSFIKRSSMKHNMLRTMSLEKHRDVMRNAIAEQSEELQLQEQLLAEQHKRIIEMQNNTIISLSNLVENRDSDTGEHVRRTSAYVNLLTIKAKVNGIYADQISTDFIELITKAAPMHDIGKITVPDRILKKPGKLTVEEFEEVKKHTTEGGRIVQEIFGKNEEEAYLKMTKEIVISHHERWDGTGYPYGLKGEDIPLCARIMAIADVFDALVSPRCYKQPFSITKAMEIIREESGSHFDPKLAELFLSMEDDALAIMDKYKD